MSFQGSPEDPDQLVKVSGVYDELVFATVRNSKKVNVFQMEVLITLLCKTVTLFPMHLKLIYHISSVITHVFFHPEQSQNLDPSKKMDLDP